MRRSRAANAASPPRPPRPTSSVWRRRPAGAVSLGDREDDGAEARRREHGSTQVESSPARLLRIGGNDLQCGNGERHCDRKVDVEDHPPVAELGEDAADEDADGGACASDCSPGGERLRPLVPLEGGHDDRERRRREHRRAKSLACAGREQGARRAGHRRRERRCGEDSQAGQEHPPPSEQISRAAPEEEEAAEDERVAGDRPADAGAAELKVVRDARHRDVHGRDVEDDHQLGDENGAEEHAACLAAGLGVGRCACRGRPGLSRAPRSRSCCP